MDPAGEAWCRVRCFWSQLLDVCVWEESSSGSSSGGSSSGRRPSRNGSGRGSGGGDGGGGAGVGAGSGSSSSRAFRTPSIKPPSLQRVASEYGCGVASIFCDPKPHDLNPNWALNLKPSKD